MTAAHIVLPAPPLREFVHVYVFRAVDFSGGAVVLPVSAEPDARLSFSLGDSLAAWEYAHDRTRLLPPVLVVGPQSRRVADLTISGRHRAIAVNFLPGGLYRLFGAGGTDLVDRAEDATALLDPALEALRQRLGECADIGSMTQCMDRYLLSRLQAARSPQSIHRAAQILRREHGMVDLSDVVAATGHSVRHFDRLFLAQFGMTPKRYARVSRFGYALRLKLGQPGLTWTAVSHEAGYFDQNHMVKDFRDLARDPPSVYLRAISAASAVL